MKESNNNNKKIRMIQVQKYLFQRKKREHITFKKAENKNSNKDRKQLKAKNGMIMVSEVKRTMKKQKIIRRD